MIALQRFIDRLGQLGHERNHCIETKLYIQQSIANLESHFGVEKKNFELPNFDDNSGHKTKCLQFELLLESFEGRIKILKTKKGTMEPPKNLTKVFLESC